MIGNHLQITIRELTLLVLFFAMGFGGLISGGLLASVVVSTVLIILIGSAIVALVARDELRALAIGFFIPVIAYGVLVLTAGSDEIDSPFEGKLLTTQIARSVHSLVVKTEWADMATGKVVPDYDPATDPNRGSGGLGGFSGGGGMTPTIGPRQTPSVAGFMLLAHVLLATMFGYIGAKFAVHIHRPVTRFSKTGDEQISI